MYNVTKINAALDVWRAATFPEIQVVQVPIGLVHRTEGYNPSVKFFYPPEAPMVYQTSDRAVPVHEDFIIEDLQEYETRLYTALPFDVTPRGVVSKRDERVWHFIPQIGFIAHMSFVTTTGFMSPTSPPTLWTDYV